MEAVDIDVRDATAPTVVAFGGLAQGLAMPPFEFFGLLDGLGVNRVLVRDLDQLWYQKGIAGVATGIEGTAAWLRTEVPGSYRIHVGNSAGGWAAILFGILSQADEVHAFAPQSFIGRWRRLVHRDRRWASRADLAGSNAAVTDLRSLLRSEPRPPIHVYYSSTHRLDRLHARRLRHYTIQHPVPAGDHAVIRDLRDSGELKILLEEAVRRGAARQPPGPSGFPGS